ncbi:uncharacterized protein EI90DRAFT_2912815 [Cantharellus anzutake]|uniref:uncharacterized protein n=1 Tax=Cantharellus anzutake TaxID=1750568 RepID=UPI001907BA8B|nr:uncharacterized protein EI90DRAFT_2912815 [Cantharellus anzutake]KAF8335881.1 hypothetical protein EI90DRAFT_2912815 [Cantharellus anzutake]
MAEDLSIEETLVKIRGHVNSGLANQSKPAHVLVAVEGALKERNQPPTAVALYTSLQVTLKEAIARENGKLMLGEGDVIPAVLYLLSLILPHVTHAIIRSQLVGLLEIITPLFPQLDKSAPPLRSLIGIYGTLFPILDQNLLTSALLLRQSYALILQYTLDSRPKVRKKAQEVVVAAISSPPPPILTHPYANQTAEAIIDALQMVTNSPAKSKGVETGIWVCAFVKHLAPTWPPSQLDNLLRPLLALPSLLSPYLTSESYGLLSVLLRSPTLVLPASNILSSLLQFIPTHHSQAEAWLEAVENTMVALARTSSEECSASLWKVWTLAKRWLSSDEDAVRLASEKALCAMARYCITDEAIRNAASAWESKSSLVPAAKDGAGKAKMPTLLSIISDLNSAFHAVAYAKAVSSLLLVLSALLSRLRTRLVPDGHNSPTAAELLLGELVQHAGKLRASNGFEYKQEADETLGTAIRVLGPAAFLNLLPLNIIPGAKNRKNSELQGRAYLLPLLASHICNTQLSHFISTFIPLSEELFNLKTEAEKSERSAEVKVWHVLIDQIWACFKGYCELCTDVSEAFTNQFARLITNLLYTQPSLRNSILLGLRVLVESVQTVANSSAPPDALTWGFGMSQVDARKNLEFLGTLASNMILVLFNVFSTTGSEERGPVGEAIKAWLTIAGPSDAETMYNKLLEMLQTSLQDTAPQSGDIPLSHTSLDLILLLLPHLPPPLSSALLEKACSKDLLESKDRGVQKRAYRILARSIESVSVIRDDSVAIERLVKRIVATSQSILPGVEKDRIGLLAVIVPSLPNGELHLIASFITEVVLATKEDNSKARIGAFDLLVSMGARMSEGGTIKRNLIQDMDNKGAEPLPASIEEFITMVAAGLVGTTPHMISATITAISRIMFEFKDRVSPKMQTEVLTTVTVFLRSANREIVKSALGFAKLAVTVLPVTTVQPILLDLVPALLGWSHDQGNRFKLKVRHIFERMGRRFGWDNIIQHAGDNNSGGYKVIQNVKKRKDMMKRKKAAKAQENDESSSDDEPKPRVTTGDAFHDVLYGSESEAEDSGGESGRKQKPQLKGKGQAQRGRSVDRREAHSAKIGTRLRIDNDDPTDLLHAGATSITSLNPRKKRQPGQEASHFRTEESGKLVISDDSDNGGVDRAEDDAADTQMALVDDFNRGPRGEVKFHKNTKKRRAEDSKAEDVEMADRDAGEGGNKRKKYKQEPVRLGREFKAKNAGGDAKRGGVDPYAYLPLAKVGTKKGRSTKYSFTGKRK